MLQQALLWYNTVFLIPILLGLVVVIGMLAGMPIDGAHDVDTEHDTDHPFGFAEFLGFGRCPVVIIVTTMSLTFGVTGMVLNNTMRVDGVLGFMVSFIGSLIVMLAATGFVARMVVRFMPTLETTSTSRSHLIREEGTSLMSLSPDVLGTVQVIYGGDVYVIRATATCDIAALVRVIVVEYDEDSDTYVVCPAHY